MGAQAGSKPSCAAIACAAGLAGWGSGWARGGFFWGLGLSCFRFFVEGREDLHGAVLLGGWDEHPDSQGACEFACHAEFIIQVFARDDRVQALGQKAPLDYLGYDWGRRVVDRD